MTEKWEPHVYKNYGLQKSQVYNNKYERFTEDQSVSQEVKLAALLEKIKIVEGEIRGV